MDGSRKRARNAVNDEVAGAPAAAKAPKSPKSTDAASATKIAELQAELETLKQIHMVAVDELKAKVDALQAENESRRRENKGLNSALQWACATERIPRQYWLERGHSEEYADAMEKLLDSFKQIIATLRVGAVISEDIIELNFLLQEEDENYIRADHDESLAPYWREFAAALKHWSEYHANDKCLHIGFRHIEMPKVVLDMLRPSFEEARIKGVLFDKSRGDIAEFVKKVLQANCFITEVCFGNIKFAEEDVETICGTIKSRNAGGRFIESLTLFDCFEDGIDTQTLKMILASITTGSAKDVQLCLNDNGMSSREAGVVAEFLTSNLSLARLHLNLEDNQFNDADAAVLANALSGNTYLRNIWVEDNSIKEGGRLAFLRAIFDVSSLSSCAASNHTCRVRGLERDISVINSYESASVNKWSKIFAMLALSSGDSFINTALLRGVPAQLIPVILNKCNGGFAGKNQKLVTDLYLELTNTTRCQQHDVWDNLGKMKSLNCMHNLMKSWVVPSIFV